MRAAAAVFALALAACDAADAPETNVAAPAATIEAAPPPAPIPKSEAGLDVIPVMIETDQGRHVFQAEVARTPEQQSQGLMFRKTLADDAAMIFPFAPPRDASFWMKDTLVPLDMIFVRADGSIARIAADVPPETLDPVMVMEPVAAVLEIAGGRAAALGIDERARVRW